jgi:hypothetical protein
MDEAKTSNQPHEHNAPKRDSFTIVAHVAGKRILVPCGDASQRVVWLGSVAIAKWDENLMGWKKLGTPVTINAHRRNGELVDLNSHIRDVLQDGDEIFVATSLQP